MKYHLHSHKQFGLITVKVLHYPIFNQQSLTLVQMLTSVKVSAILPPPGIVSTWRSHRKGNTDSSWNHCNSCQLRRRYIPPCTRQQHCTDPHSLFLNTVYKQHWEICNENTTYHMTTNTSIHCTDVLKAFNFVTHVQTLIWHLSN